MKRRALRDRAWKKAQRAKARREEPWKYTSDNHAIILKVIRDLYADQLEHWNAKLQEYCKTNSNVWAATRMDEAPEEERNYVRRMKYNHNYSQPSAGISLNPQTQLHWHTNKTQAEEGFYYLPVHDDMSAEWVKEVWTCHHMREELIGEREVIRNFLSFAMGFGVTWDYFAHSLDSDILTDYFNESRVKQEPLDTSDPAVRNRLNQFDDYIKKNQSIVETMANRQLENLLLGDIL